MKKLTKEQVYVLIDNQPDCDRAIEILTKAGEPMWNDSYAFKLLSSTRELRKDTDDGDWYLNAVPCDKLKYTQVTLDDLERILMPKIKKAELLDRIEDLEENVLNLGNLLKDLTEKTNKVTIVHPAEFVGDSMKEFKVVFGDTRQEVEEPQYQAGTLGAFWDGDFDECLEKGTVLFGVLDHITEKGHFRRKGASWSWYCFKPLKFD